MSAEQNVASSNPAAVQGSQPVPRSRLAVIAKWGGGAVGMLLLVALVIQFTVGWLPTHSTPAQPPAAVVATQDPLADSVNKGIEFLKVHQEQTGHFSKGLLDPRPAFTALVVEALCRGEDGYREKDHEWLRKAVQAIKSEQREDGAICSSFGNAANLSNYVTCISLLALTAVNNPEHQDVIEKAKAYLLKIQRTKEKGLDEGGVGYGPDGRSDGNNTAMWVESLRSAGVKEDSEAMKKAGEYFARLQNDAETNTAVKEFEGVELSNDGGFIYRPGEGNDDIPDDVSRTTGKRMPKSYGLMSYAGLKTFLLINASKSDKHVKSAWRWVRENYTLEENRNLGPKGLYFYYMTMAKALAAYGDRSIETSDGQKHDWARELSDKILAMQWDDGRWVNRKNSAWMENDPVLVTSYAIRTLKICQAFLKSHPAGEASKSEAGAEKPPAPAASEAR